MKEEKIHLVFHPGDLVSPTPEASHAVDFITGKIRDKSTFLNSTYNCLLLEVWTKAGEIRLYEILRPSVYGESVNRCLAQTTLDHWLIVSRKKNLFR